MARRISGQRKRNKRKRILARDGHMCVGCGRTSQLTLDHIIPLAAGGTNADSNLQTLCASCNHAKDAEDQRIFRYNRPKGTDPVGTVQR